MATGRDFDLRAAIAEMALRGADAAQGHVDEVPPWDQRPDIEGEWDSLGLPAGSTVDRLDHDQRRSLEQAWMDGYEQRREELNRKRGFGV